MFCIAQEQIIEHENIKPGATGTSFQHYTAQSMCHLLTELVTRFPDKKKTRFKGFTHYRISQISLRLHAKLQL